MTLKPDKWYNYFEVRQMCNNCGNIILRKSFYSKRDFINCTQYIRELIDSGRYETDAPSLDIDSLKDKDGVWINDIFRFTVRCKECGQEFVCCADTYHGNGGFVKK